MNTETTVTEASAAKQMELRQVIDRFYEDWTPPLNDPGKWYRSDALVFDTTPPPAIYRSRDEYVAGVQKLFYDRMERVEFKVKEILRILEYVEIAVVELIISGTIIPKGQTASSSLDSRATQVWAREGGRWVLISEHNSVPLIQ